MGRIIDEESERDMWRSPVPEREKSRPLSTDENKRELAKARSLLNGSAEPRRLFESAA